MHAGGNPDSNTLISDMTTVICLDDYHCLDRKGRSEKKVTALAPAAQNFDLMASQVKALKEGKSVDKPIYNHVSGLIDAPEKVESPKVRALRCLASMHAARCTLLPALPCCGGACSNRQPRRWRRGRGQRSAYLIYL